MQAQEPVSVHLSEKDGLPDKEFYDIFEDDKGFIWLAADKGLFRYDGKSFKGYTHEKQQGLSVFNLQQDYLGRIWCTNISGQFFYIQNGKMTLFLDLSTQLNGELAEFIVKENYIWVFKSYHFYKINLRTKVIEFNKKKRSGNLFTHKGLTYYSSNDSIFSISSKDKVKPLLPINLPYRDKNDISIVQGKSKIFAIGSSMFLLQKRLGINAFFEFSMETKNLHSINGFNAVEKERIYNQFENDNEIWLATSSGVWVYEFIGDRFQLKKRFLNKNNVTKILKDKDDNYWFTTLNEGVYVIPNIYIETCSITDKNITSLDVVNDSTLVFGNTKGDIGFYNVTTNKETIVSLPTEDRVSILKYHANQNTLFISKDFSGYTLNDKTLKIAKVENFQTSKSITILENNDLLFTNHNNAIIRKNGGLKSEIKYISRGKRTYASHYNKTTKSAYIAFVDDLIRYDSIWNAKPIRYKNKPIYVKSITASANGIVWASTFKNGVFGIKNDTILHHYTTTNGLTSKNIEKIKADQNKLWIALSNSVQVLDINTKQLKTLTKRDGIISYDISGIEILNNRVYFSSNEGLFSVDKKKGFKTQDTKVYFNTLEINEKSTSITSSYQLKYNQNAIKIGFNVNGFLYNKKGRYQYRLKGFNDNWIITDTGVNAVKYNSLPAGKYTFQVQPFLNHKSDATKIKELEFFIKKPFWETWWFILGIATLILGSIILYFKNKIRIKEKERIAQLEKISLEKEMIALNLTALRSQMNPHFIFNALNSIQDLILKQDTDASYDYIVLFAELIRNTLSYSNQDFIPLEKESDFLKVYLKLEKLRFGNSFNYSINLEEKEGLEVPSLLIQPFIENALVHGLLHKTGDKKLTINFRFIDDTLQCVITDNGIGRKKAQEIAKRQGNRHESFALNAIEKRLKIFKKQYNENIGYVIEDLYKNETTIGTKVILTMPFRKRF